MKLYTLCFILIIISSCNRKQNNHISIEQTDSIKEITINKWNHFKIKYSVPYDSISTQCDRPLIIKWHDSIISIMPFDTGIYTLRFLKSGNFIDSFIFTAYNNKYFNEDWKKITNGFKPSPMTQEEENAYNDYFHNSYRYKLLGKKAPEFKIININGEKVSSDDFKGKTTLINFWEYGCVPCMEEIPALNKLKLIFEKDSMVQFLSFYYNNISINPDTKALIFETNGNTSDQRKIKVDFKFTQIANSKRINDLYNVYGFPTNMIIDKNGIIRQIFVGAQEGDNKNLLTELTREIRQLK